MSHLQLPRFTNKKNSLEIERENFEKGQEKCLQKAVNMQETAVKEKHVRSAIIGTFQERGATTFWECAIRIPLKENPIICWKFCHVLHKVLREGHDNVLRDSQKFRHFLADNAKFWSLLRSGYGILIKVYCNLLIMKLGFHQRNNRIRGNLELRDSEFQSILAEEPDVPYQLAVEMLDYLDHILELQNEIFKTMDPKYNSMTSAGQCRLKPLIPCIQEAMVLYDYVTRILYRLHTGLPPDVLSGHRKRFETVFGALKQFFEKAMSLQYFKSLIEIQQLPRNPPNFLEASDIHNYQTRIVVVKEDPREREMLDNSSDTTSTTSELVDLQDTNGAGSPDPSYMTLILEKQRMNEQLQLDMDHLKGDFDRLQSEASSKIHQLNFENQELKTEYEEMKKAMEEAKRREAEHECKAPAEQLEQLDRTEKHIKGLEEKYTKMKDVYSGLRTEHIDLLRKKAAIDKELTDLKKAAESQSEMALLLENRQKEHEKRLLELTEASEKQTVAADEQARLIAQLRSELDNALVQNKSLESTFQSLLDSSEAECMKLHGTNAELESQLQASEQKLKTQMEQSISTLSAKDQQIDSFKNEIEGLKSDLSNECAARTAIEMNLHEQLAAKQMTLDQLNEKSRLLESDLEEIKRSKSDAEAKHEEETKQSLSTIATLQQEVSNLKRILQNTMAELNSAKSFGEATQIELRNSQEATEKVRVEMQTALQDHAETVSGLQAGSLAKYNQLLDISLSQHENILRRSLEEMENPILIGATGCLDNFIVLCSTSLSDEVPSFEKVTRNGLASYDEIKDIIANVPLFTSACTALLIHGSATSRTSADIQKGDVLLTSCKAYGNAVLNLLSCLKARPSQDKLGTSYEVLYEALKNMMESARKMSNTFPSETDAAEALDQELHAMEQAIEEAAKKMEEILSHSRASHTGVKLEVNEKLIDSCTGLMNAIKMLVQRAKFLQTEIAAQGKGSASVKEFYKRNHQWTEGLISAAKAVGIGAKFLLESADKAVSTQNGTFEFLIASSQEIAASTIQLVVASQVRADRSSKNLSLLKQASTGVKTATAHVVATAKDCAQLIEESDEVDVTKLSPHYAKRMELETQAEVLKLETDLEKCRMKLASLRQHHYHNDA